MTSHSPKGPKKRRRPWWFRVLRATTVAFLSLWLLYVVGANTFLALAFEKVVNGDPESVDIHFTDGWTIFPGRIHAKGLSIRGRDSSVEWILRIDAVEFDVSLIGLTRKHFSISRVQGDGLSFRLRRNLDAPPASPLEIADHPPIRGFPLGYWLRPPGESADVWSDADWHLWTIRLENISAKNVREVWIDSKRFQGAMSIDGRFYLKPLRAIDVGPAVAILEHGQVSEGTRFVLVDQLGGHINAQIEQFDPRKTKGAGMLHHVNLATDVRARCPDLANWPLPDGTTATGVVDARKVVVKLSRGVVQAGSYGDLGPNSISVLTKDHRVSGDVAVTFSTEQIDAHTQLAFRVHAIDLFLSRGGSDPSLRVQRVIAAGDTKELDLTAPFGDLHATIDVSNAAVPDARAALAYLPQGSPWAVRKGRVAADGHAEVWVAEKRAAGHARAQADDVDVSHHATRVRTAFIADASVASYRWDTGVARGAWLVLEISTGSVALAGTKSPLIVADALRCVARADEVSADSVSRAAVELKSPKAGLRYGDFAVGSAVIATARIHNLRHGEVALDEGVVELSRLTLSRRNTPAAGLTIARAVFGVTSPRLKLDDPLRNLAVIASIGGGRVRDSAIIDQVLPKDAPIHISADGSNFAIQMRANIANHIARGQAGVTATGIGIAGKKLHVRGDVAANVNVVDVRLRDKTMRVLDSQVVVTQIEGGFTRKGPIDFLGDRVEVRASSPEFDLANPKLGSLDVRLIVDQATIADARTMKSLLPEGAFVVESGTARVSADVKVSSSKGTSSGAVAVALSRAGFSLHETRIDGDYLFTAQFLGFNREKSTLNISGSSLQMRNVTVSHASAVTTGWRGDVVLDRAVLRIDDKPHVDAVVRLDARDATPFLALALRYDLPKVFVPYTQMPRFQATARISAKRGEVSIGNVAAEGGALRLYGLYGSRGKVRRGAFVIGFGPLGAGLRLDSEGTHLRFFGLDSWMRRERAAVKNLLKSPSTPVRIASDP